MCVWREVLKLRAHSFGTTFPRFLFWYKNNRTYRISIPKRTNFVLFWKQNSWRDKNWGDETEKSLGTQFLRQKTGENCQKNTMTGYSVYSEQTAIPSILLSGAELTEYYSVHSGIRTEVPKEHSYRQFRVFSFRNSPKRMHPEFLKIT